MKPAAPLAPHQLLSSRLSARPEQVWARVCHSGFIARYLGAWLPEADLARTPDGAAALQGRWPDGRPLAVSVASRLAPGSLTLCLRTPGEAPLLLQLAIAACADGGGASRLTVLHQPLGDGLALLGPGLADAAASTPGARWAQPLPAALQAGAWHSPGAQQAAQAYLAETAAMVQALRLALGPRQGYTLPADGGFSLVQHLWHLADVESLGWLPRLARLRQEHHPVLPGVDGDRLARDGCYQQRPWRGAAWRFLRLRRRSLAELARWGPDTLQRLAVFNGQAATAADVLAAMLAHDHEHREAMARLWPTGPGDRPRPTSPAFTPDPP